MNYALLLKQAVMLKLASKAKTLKRVIPQAKAWNPQKSTSVVNQALSKTDKKRFLGTAQKENPHSTAWNPQPDPVSSYGSYGT